MSAFITGGEFRLPLPLCEDSFREHCTAALGWLVAPALEKYLAGFLSLCGTLKNIGAPAPNPSDDFLMYGTLSHRGRFSMLHARRYDCPTRRRSGGSTRVETKRLRHQNKLYISRDRFCLSPYPSLSQSFRTNFRVVSVSQLRLSSRLCTCMILSLARSGKRLLPKGLYIYGIEESF